MQEQEKRDLVVLHVHHGLREREADRDCRLVEEQASMYGLPFETIQIPPESYAGRENLQSRARDLRYAYFEETAERWNAQKIATGHQRDDHVETLLMQMFRGTGSLRGIRPVRDGRYIRPLIDVSREDLLSYAADRGVPYHEDSSNRNTRYLRNRIRKEMVPWIRAQINPSFDRSLTRLSAILQDEDDCLDRLAGRAFDRASRPPPASGVVALRRTVLEELEPALRRRVIRLAYARIRGSTFGLSYSRVQEICRCLDSGRSVLHRRFPLHGGIHLFLETRELLLSREDLWSCRPYQYPLAVGEFLRVPEARTGVYTRLVSCSQVDPETGRTADQTLLAWDPSAGEVLVRNFRPGDRFRPAGMGGEKKLKDFFIDQKITRSQRVRIPLLEIGGVIAWVAGQRMDERFRPLDRNRSCLHVRLVRDGDPDA